MKVEHIMHLILHCMVGGISLHFFILEPTQVIGDKVEILAAWTANNYHTFLVRLF